MRGLRRQQLLISTEADENGVVPVEVSVLVNGEKAEEIVFNNIRPEEPPSEQPPAITEEPPSDIPKTGDVFDLRFYLCLTAVSAAAFAAAMIAKRKEKR